MLDCDTAGVCWKDRMFPPPSPLRLSVYESIWHVPTLLYALTLSRHELSIKRAHTPQSHKQAFFPLVCPKTLGALRLPPPSLASLMRTGPCVFDPAASRSPAAPQPHAYSTIPTASPVTPPLPWVHYGSKGKHSWVVFLISKPVWLKLWGKREKGGKNNNLALCSVDLQAALELFFVSSDVLQKCHVLTVHERFQGFKCQLIGFADCVLGRKQDWKPVNGLNNMTLLLFCT